MTRPGAATIAYYQEYIFPDRAGGLPVFVGWERHSVAAATAPIYPVPVGVGQMPQSAVHRFCHTSIYTSQVYLFAHCGRALRGIGINGRYHIQSVALKTTLPY
jgi:hypothetical protein